MQSACTTGNRVIGSIFLSILFSINALAQDNSPWSRYGLGDPVPGTNIVNRAMGGAAAAYADLQTINFTNPASYSLFGAQKAIFDVGLDINNRTIRNNAGLSYSSANAIIPYLAAGFQIRPQKSKINWGLAFGLRPVTKVSYKIQTGTRLLTGDSVATQYEGSGGVNQAFAGTAIGYKNFSIGINGGYRFGSKDYTTRVSILNDTVPNRYTPGQKEVRNNFGSAFIELGVQQRVKINENSSISFGAYGSMQTSMRGTKDEVYESFAVGGDGGIISRVDSVSELKNVRGAIEYPSYFGFGVLYDFQKNGKLMIAADYVRTNWKNYRFYGSPDALQNAWQAKAGIQLIPMLTGDKQRTSYWSRAIYRAGFNLSREPFLINNTELNSYGFTLGMGLPVGKYGLTEILYRNHVINLAFEFGQRGNKNSVLRENFFRLSAGFSLSDIWFIKRKYD
jgi:hypothetical protein